MDDSLDGNAQQLVGNSPKQNHRQVADDLEILFTIPWTHHQKINTAHYRIQTWDAGLYQIRFTLRDADLATGELKALATANAQLADKIRSHVRELDFMR